MQSDGGPQFINAEFQVFANNWELKHFMSSPYLSQSAVERKSRIGSQDREQYYEEIRRTFESGVGVAKHANVSNQLLSSATANAKTYAGGRASSGAVDEIRGTNGTSNPQKMSQQ